MNEWSLFLVSYGIFLIVGFTIALVYRWQKTKTRDRAFGELMKIRTNFFTQLQAVSEAYRDVRRRMERSKRDETVDKAVDSVRTFANDVNTNISMIHAELESIRLRDEIDGVRMSLAELSKTLSDHLARVAAAEDNYQVGMLVSADDLPRIRREFQALNSQLKAYMKKRGIDTTRFSGLDWLLSPDER